MQTRFQVAPKILRELISEEVVIINMLTGSYYSLTDLGASIWDMIEQGLSLDRILQSLINQYEASSEVIQASLDQLIVSLATEGLIVAKTDEIGASSPIETVTALIAKKPFVAPVLSKYDDMQELLLVDPIHDVDESGWPNVKTEIAA
jgi:hypothetical protein